MHLCGSLRGYEDENWLACHVHAFQYFDGVTRLLIPDNCKTATTVNTRYETVSNRSCQELAEYYGTAIIPARIRNPQDKSAAECCLVILYIHRESAGRCSCCW